jgi:Na+-transporting methylmalonyl-CoA/oxaloacetate decarboxylase gamma subunit
MMLEGLRLMAVGMFTVFAFLIFLVGLIKLSAIFFDANAHWFSEDEPAGAARSENDAEIAVAIVLAEAKRQGQRV